LIVESSRLWVEMGAGSQRCESLKLMAEKDKDATPSTTMAGSSAWRRKMSQVLRGASDRNNGQMPPVTEGVLVRGQVSVFVVRFSPNKGSQLSFRRCLSVSVYRTKDSRRARKGMFVVESSRLGVTMDSGWA
jgi:hypothetical protein